MKIKRTKCFLKKISIRIGLGIVILILGFMHAYSQCYFADRYGAGGNDSYGCDITLDPRSNSYSVGKIWNNSTSTYNLKLQKRDETGNIIWTTTENANLGDAFDPEVYQMNIAYYNGNVYVTGLINGTINLSSNLFNSINGNIIVAKYDAGTGNFVTGYQPLVNVSGGISGLRMCMDNSGNFFLAGSFVENLTIGSITYTSIGWPTYPAEDLFIIKLDPTGNILWQRKAGGSGNDYVLSIAYENYFSVDQLCIGGSYQGNFTYPPGYQISGSFGINGVDGYVIKINPATGMQLSPFTSINVVPIGSVGGHGVDVKAVKIKNGILYFAGNAYDSHIYVQSAGLQMNNTFDNKFYAATIPFDFSASVSAHEMGYNGDFFPLDIAFNSTNLFITGYYSGSNATFGGSPSSAAVNLPSYGNNDIFVARCNLASFYLDAAYHYGGIGNNESYAIESDDCHFYYTGSFNGTSNFNPVVLNSSSSSYTDQFVSANGVYGGGNLTISSSTSNNLLCYGGTVTLTSQPSGLSYLWGTGGNKALV